MTCPIPIVTACPESADEAHFRLDMCRSFNVREEELLDEYDHHIVAAPASADPPRAAAAQWRRHIDAGDAPLAFTVEQLTEFVKCWALHPKFRLEELLQERYRRLFRGAPDFRVTAEERATAARHSRAENCPSPEEAAHWRSALQVDYFNASRIDGPGAGVQYIATQHPLGHTRRDFWRCVARARPCVVLMLNGREYLKLRETGDAGELPAYFPEAPGEALDFAGVAVRCVAREDIENTVRGVKPPAPRPRSTVIRRLEVRAAAGEPHALWHVQCNFWRDQTHPATPFFLRLLNAVADRVGRGGGGAAPVGARALHVRHRADRDVHRGRPGDAGAERWRGRGGRRADPGDARAAHEHGRAPHAVHVHLPGRAGAVPGAVGGPQSARFADR